MKVGDRVRHKVGDWQGRVLPSMAATMPEPGEPIKVAVLPDGYEVSDTRYVMEDELEVIVGGAPLGSSIRSGVGCDPQVVAPSYRPPAEVTYAIQCFEEAERVRRLLRKKDDNLSAAVQQMASLNGEAKLYYLTETTKILEKYDEDFQ